MQDTHGAGRYRILSRLGVGGMGEVYLAEAVAIDGMARKVAIKVVRQLHKRRDRLVSLFVDEMRVSFALNHPNIVQTYDLGQIEGNTFLVLEYIDGAGLEALLAALRDLAQPMPVHLALYIASQVARGLEYAHSYVDNDGHITPIIHRDVSPGNILISRRGQVKIADFGLAKSALRTVKSDHSTIKGKIAYMPLEQLLGKDVDARADIYALGVILYEMIAGAHPFGEKQSLGYLDRLAQKEPPPPLDDRAAISSHLAEFVATCMASDRDDRFGDPREVVRLLDQHLQDLGASAPEFDLADLMSQVLEIPRPQSPLAGEASFFDQALGQRLERGESQGGLATFLLASRDVEDSTERSDEAVTLEDRRRSGTGPQGDQTSPWGSHPADELPLRYHPWPLWLALGLLIAAAGSTLAWWLIGRGA